MIYSVSHLDEVQSSWFLGMGNGEWGIGDVPHECENCYSFSHLSFVLMTNDQ